MTRSPRIRKLCGCCKKTSISTPDCMTLRRIWKENELQIPDCMIVRNVNLNWNHVVVATSERPIPDCMIVRGWNLKENRSPNPDCLIVRDLILKWKLKTNFPTACLSGAWSWHETEATFHDWTFLKNFRGLLNTSWWLSFIQHAWNHCESWDVWYVK